MTRISEADYQRIVAQQQRPTKQATTLPCPTEAQEQETIVQWAAHYPGADLLFHVPNGGERPKHAALAMARAGAKAGVPDLCLPVPRGGWHGLWIELKRADHSNHPTPAQAAWIERLRANGYMVVVAYGADAAIRAIEQYLEMP